MSTPTTRDWPGLFYDKGGVVFNIRHPDFGATGGGSTDDSPAFVSVDQTSRAIVVPQGTYLIESNLTLVGTYHFEAGMEFQISAGVTVSIDGPITGSPRFLGDGTVIISSLNTIRPEWWCSIGQGTEASPWASLDGTGGALGALGALQEGGSVSWKGNYSVSEGGAISDVDNRRLNFEGATINFTEWSKPGGGNYDGYLPWIDLGPNATPAGTPGSRDTLLIHGSGFMNGGTSGPYKDIILFGLNDVRNVYIRDVRTRRTRYPYYGAIRDTFRMYGGKHRLAADVLHITPFFTDLVPQGIEVRGAYTSLCEWMVNADGAFSDLTVAKCIIAAPLSGFVRAKVGNGGSLSSDSLHIHGSDVEQSPNLNVIHVVDDGNFNTLRGLLVDGKCKLSVEDSPTNTLINAERVSGVVSIKDNSIFGGSVTAIDIGLAAANTSINIEGNDFGQTSTAGGTMWTFGTLNAGAHVRFGRNRYGSDPGVQDHDLEMTSFASGGHGGLIASATSIELPDHHSTYFIITGSTNISDLTPSWAGRQITLRFGGALTVVDSPAGTLRLDGDFITSAHATLSLISDGTKWYEASRSVN